MNTRTRLIIGLTVVALGAGVVGLGFIDQESTVRYVDDIADAPAEHAHGTYMLLGMPQPQTLINLEQDTPNPAYQDSLDTVIRWHDGDDVRLSTLSTAVNITDDGSHWSLRNTTRDPSTGATISTTWSNWTITAPHIVFQIQGFPDDNGQQTTIWGVYEGVLRDPMQPKPSQFKGRVASEIAGTPIPDGPIVFHADEYTAGCSSKFLPDDVAMEYKDDPDIQ